MKTRTTTTKTMITETVNGNGDARIRHLLAASARLHRHLCPRQVLGVRMGILAGTLLGIALPQTDKRLLTIMETDGCAVDGVSVATGCTVGHRTLRIEDYGKIAVTFVDTLLQTAFRVVPQPGIRERALNHAPVGSSKWESQLVGYRTMPDQELLRVEEVQLTVPVSKLISKAGTKATCEECEEEINNEREMVVAGRVLCKSCAGQGYYRRVSCAAALDTI